MVFGKEVEYFAEAERTAGGVSFLPHNASRRGIVCALLTGLAILAATVFSLYDAARAENWLSAALQAGGTLFVLFFCYACTRSLLRTTNLRVNFVAHVVHVNTFLMGRPRSSWSYSAGEIASVSLDVCRGVVSLDLGFRSGRTWRVDRSVNAAPIEKLANDVARAIGIPVQRSGASPDDA